ncbi:MAG: NADH-quinone oxidoreductase subunit M [Geobacter sp.]|nr:NADH-quinone oxidoreductase subunit M [Geobacter sp.]
MSDSATVRVQRTMPGFGALLWSSVFKSSGLHRIGAMLLMLSILALSAGIFLNFDGTAGPSLMEINIPWIDSLGINFHLAVDGLNVYLLLLTAILFPVVLACSWSAAPSRSRIFLALMLLLELGLIGTFLSQNLMLFFIFWEAVLIPMFIMILVYGGERAREAAMTFFLYTLAGSVLLLAAVILLGVESLHQTGQWSFEFSTLYGLQLGWGTQLFVFIAVVLACAIKCPIFPFHSWLPLAYCEAPFAGTALMAGALSKMGAFGLLKLALPLAPQVSAVMAPAMVLLAVVSILYGAVLALRQDDFKRLVAYSSLSHMGYIVLGIFSFQQTALHGSLFQMLSHGLSVAGLFLMLGLLEQRVGASYRNLTALAGQAPRLAVVLMLFILTSVALPLTSGFTSEFLILFGAFQHGMATWQAGSGTLPLIATVIACSGMVLGAGYMLRFARVILFGKGSGLGIHDLKPREAVAFLPLLLLIVWVGVWPAPIMAKAQAAVTQLTAQVTDFKHPIPLLASPLKVEEKVEENVMNNGGANGR